MFAINCRRGNMIFAVRIVVIHIDLFFEERNDLAGGSSKDPIQRR